MLTRDPATPPPPPSPSLCPSHPHSTDLAGIREAFVLPGLGGRMRRVDSHLPVPASLGLSVESVPWTSSVPLASPPSAASQQVLPPALPLQSPGLRPSRLGCRGQGWGLLLALTGPSWGQERNGQRAPSVPALPHPHPKQFLPHDDVDSCQEFPRAPVLDPAHSPFSCCCPSPVWLGAGGLSGAQSQGEGERQDRKTRMGKMKRWEETEGGVQERGPSAPACLGSRCQ